MLQHESKVDATLENAISRAQFPPISFESHKMIQISRCPWQNAELLIPDDLLKDSVNRRERLVTILHLSFRSITAIHSLAFT